MSENQVWNQMREDEGIGIDKGFSGLSTRNPVYSPFVDTGNLTDAQVQWNKEIASVRTVIENVFSHLKDWGVCSQMFRFTHSEPEFLQEKHHKLWMDMWRFI